VARPGNNRLPHHRPRQHDEEFLTSYRVSPTRQMATLAATATERPQFLLSLRRLSEDIVDQVEEVVDLYLVFGGAALVVLEVA